MTLKSNGQEIPENKELSALDIQALKIFYAPLPLDPSKFLPDKNVDRWQVD